MVAGEKLPQEGGGQGGGFCVGERAPGTLFELDEAQVRQADDDVAAVDQELAVDGVGMAGGHAHPEMGKVDLVFLSGQPPAHHKRLNQFRHHFGDPFLADIVNAGWLPRAYFEAVGGPGGGRGILAFSVTFIFVDGSGNPTDINGDNYLDTALNEVYYNDTFGDSSDDRVGNPWGINIPLPGIDVQTVVLHENGHSLEVGHFGPPPDAVMNPVFAGIRQSLFPIDQAGMCIVWRSWPK